MNTPDLQHNRLAETVNTVNARWLSIPDRGRQAIFQLTGGIALLAAWLWAASALDELVTVWQATDRAGRIVLVTAVVGVIIVVRTMANVLQAWMTRPSQSCSCERHAD